MSTIHIDGVTIVHDGNVGRGLDYIERNWREERVREWFDNARRSSDKDTHLEILLDGARRRYLLKHTGPNKYFLKPLP